MFNIAFLSCWKQLSELAKKQITQSFRDLLISSDTYDTVNYEIIKLLVFMDKIEYPLDISVNDLVTSSIRYGGAAYALHLISRDIDENPGNINKVEQCIDLYAKLNSWTDAIGMWKKSQMTSNLNKVEVLAKLKMWDEVNPIYQKFFEKYKNLVLKRRIKSCLLFLVVLNTSNFCNGLKSFDFSFNNKRICSILM